MSRAVHDRRAGEVLDWPDPATLAWREVVLAAGEPIDPFALAAHAEHRPGFVLASTASVVVGCGAAAVLGLPEGLAGEDRPAAVRDWLAAVRPASGTASGAAGPAGRHGPRGPLAVGALPFSGAERAALVVPRLCYVREGDDERVIIVEADDDATWPALVAGADSPVAVRRALAETASQRRAPHRARVVALEDTSAPSFTDGVHRALAAIERGTVRKVVLARSVVASFDGAVDPAAVLRRLAEREPTASVYGVVGDDDSFVGASPELLVARRGECVESWPLAGTVALGGDPEGDRAAEHRLLSSAKERDEHAQTVEAIRRALAPFCRREPVVSGPAVARLATVAHLASEVSGTLDGDEDALTLVRALHPTPAVAGTPTHEALALLDSLEPAGRGCYAGPVGWMDAAGDGEFVVAIRGASLSGSTATLYAGAGIVAGSDPGRELAETTVKLRTALGALGDPGPDRPG
jgi:isochorismate synthase